jgi:hypothetical protein
MNDEAARQGRPANSTPVDSEDSHSSRWPDAGRLWRAFMLAPTLEICAALLADESVPLDRLDVEWVTRFGLARRAA